MQGLRSVGTFLSQAWKESIDFHFHVNMEGWLSAFTSSSSPNPTKMLVSNFKNNLTHKDKGNRKETSANEGVNRLGEKWRKKL